MENPSPNSLLEQQHNQNFQISPSQSKSHKRKNNQLLLKSFESKLSFMQVQITQIIELSNQLEIQSLKKPNKDLINKQNQQSSQVKQNKYLQSQSAKIQEIVSKVRNQWVDLMMQMQENNYGVDQMTNQRYFTVLQVLSKEICKISHPKYYDADFFRTTENSIQQKKDKPIELQVKSTIKASNFEEEKEAIPQKFGKQISEQKIRESSGIMGIDDFDQSSEQDEQSSFNSLQLISKEIKCVQAEVDRLSKDLKFICEQKKQSISTKKKNQIKSKFKSSFNSSQLNIQNISGDNLVEVQEEEKIGEGVNQIQDLNIIKDKLELEFDQIPEEIEKPMHSIRSSNCRQNSHPSNLDASQDPHIDKHIYQPSQNQNEIMAQNIIKDISKSINEIEVNSQQHFNHRSKSQQKR